MNRAQRLVRSFVHILAAAVWLLVACPAIAQPAPPADSGGGGGGSMDYMLSYMVVILAIVLGMLIVGRASSRRDRERPEGYVEKNIMADE